MLPSVGEQTLGGMDLLSQTAAMQSHLLGTFKAARAGCSETRQMFTFLIKREVKRFSYHHWEVTSKSSSFCTPSLWQSRSKTQHGRGEKEVQFFPSLSLCHS